MAEFPVSLWDGNPQDPGNDGPPDPKNFQARDYNETADEVIAIQTALRNGAILAIRNQSGGILAEGDYVRINGESTGLPLVVKAIASSESTLSDGVIIATIADNTNGNIALRHRQGAVNTVAFGVAGTDLFLSDSVAGEAVTVKPTIVQNVGTVVKQDASGTLLHTVDISGGSAALPGHDFAGVSHTPSTIAEVNTKISDGPIDKASDPRTPTAHAPTHSDGGTDEISVEALATAGAVNTVPKGDGAGGLAMGNVAHSEVTDVTADQHHTEDHASRHSDGGADEVAVANLAEATVPGNDASQALRPDGAGGVAFSDVDHSDLTGITADQHHAQDHASRHADGSADEVPVAGLAEAAAPGNDVSQALRPDGAGGVAFSDVGHGELTGVTADQHHTEDHASRHSDGGADEVTVQDLGSGAASINEVLTADGAGGLSFAAGGAPAAHAASHSDGGADEVAVANLAEATAPGNDVSQALRPDGAGGVAFSDVGHDDLTGVTADQHHTEDHASRHADGGADEAPVASLAEAAAPGNDVSQALRPDGAGGVAFSDVAHADLTGVTADQHHAQTHASAHSDGGADEVTVEDLATASADTSAALRPDGVGGLAFSDIAHADLTSVTADQHHAQDHASRHSDGGADEITVQDLGSGGASASDVLTADGAGGLAFATPGAPGAHAATHADGGTDEVPVAGLAEAAVPGNDVSQALRPDGAGGVAFSDVAHADLTGVGIDDHHARDHASTHVNGTDDIQDATAAQKGLVTATQITKLDGVAAGAEVNAVDSVFSRTGAVVAALSDYDASQVDNDSGVAGATVAAALDQLDSDISGIGVAEDVFTWVLNGNVNAGTRFDGGRVARRAGTILGVIVFAGGRGNNGTSLFDLNKHVPTKPITTQRNATLPVTLYTTQGNRPDLDGNSPTSGDNAVKEAVLPDITAFAAGDILSMDVDNAVNQLKDVTVQMFVKYS